MTLHGISVEPFRKPPINRRNVMQEVVALLHESDIHHMVVIDSSRHMSGLFSGQIPICGQVVLIFTRRWVPSGRYEA
jgi:CBS-domain-containing membrane protein